MGICSADGRRFASQLELSKHLDALFRKAQLEKSIDKTEERDWYHEESVWIKGSSNKSALNDDIITSPMSSDSPADEATATTASVVADESRDRCPVCGINFDMFFDQESSEWHYKNCIEKSVEDDGPTMDDDEEKVLLHFTCWKGLGSPEFVCDLVLFVYGILLGINAASHARVVRSTSKKV